MKLLSLKSASLRYLCATVLITLAGIIPNSATLFLLVPIAIISVKFLVYDGVIAAIKSKLPTLKVSPWLLIGYGATVGLDMLFVYGATKDEVDAGFAFLGTFMLTPWILAAAIVVMLVATYLRRKQ